MIGDMHSRSFRQITCADFLGWRDCAEGCQSSADCASPTWSCIDGGCLPTLCYVYPDDPNALPLIDAGVPVDNRALFEPCRTVSQAVCLPSFNVSLDATVGECVRYGPPSGSGQVPVATQPGTARTQADSATRRTFVCSELAPPGAMTGLRCRARRPAAPEPPASPSTVTCLRTSGLSSSPGYARSRATPTSTPATTLAPRTTSIGPEPAVQAAAQTATDALSDEPRRDRGLCGRPHRAHRAGSALRSGLVE